MKYCENCHFVFDGEARCPLCGTKILREVRADDFCLLIEESKDYCNTLKDIFKQKDIECVALPYGTGVRSQFAMPLENYRLFVPYSSFNEAKDIVRDLENSETEELREKLLQNTDFFNISPRLERKLRKQFNLPDEADIFDFCIDIIKSANKIVKKGGACAGNYFIFCYCDNLTLAFDEKTYEILSLTQK